jgi:hypothetical protein
MGDIPVLLLLHPEALPQSSDEVALQRSEPLSEVLRLSLAGDSALTDTDLLACLRGALRALPAARHVPLPSSAKKEIADNDSHDEYCRIQRAIGEDTLSIFVHSILVAYEELIIDRTESGTSLSDDHWSQLLLAFQSMLHFLNGDLGAETTRADALFAAGPCASRQECDSVARWLRGHHVFLVLIQCVITSLNCFFNAARSRDLALSALTLDLAATLFRGCSAALHFAADFSPLAYETTVRPTMMPPKTAPGMSGVLARDHEHLVHLLRSHKRVFAEIDPALRQPYESFVGAFESAYVAHKLVCSQFVGDGRPSLLNRSEQPAPAIEVLDKLKNTRLRSFHEGLMR